MDKSTLTGLLLMAAVMFGFMYLNKPAKEDAAPKGAQDVEALASETPAELLAFAPGDSAALVSAIRNTGTENEGSYSYEDQDLNLRYSAEGGLEGTVKTDSTATDVRALLSGRTVLEGPSQLKAVRAVRKLIDKTAKYQGFARQLGGEGKELTLENELIKVKINTKGAMVSEVTLKKYRSEVHGDTALVTLFTPATDNYSFRFYTADQRIDTRDFNFNVTAESDTAVMLTLEPAAGASWGIRYTLEPDSYLVGMELVQEGMSKVLPASTASIDFDWRQKMVRNEQGRTFEERNSSIMYKYLGDSPDELSNNKDAKKDLNGKVRWVAFKNQFFSSVLIAREPFTQALLVSNPLKDNKEYLKDMSMAASLPYTTGDGTAARFDFYFGPNDYPLLSKLEDKICPDEDLSLTRLIPLGWGIFRWVNVILIIPVFDFLGRFISSYGLIIFLLTVFIKLILFPFTFKSYKSQARMRVLAPEIKEINEKYPGNENAMLRQQKTMELYSKAGANPMSGCLPMLLQMPVLIAMFSFFPSAIELRGQSFLWAHDLSAPDSILTLPFTIPFYGNHVSLFCLLMTTVNIIYMHISMQNQPGGQSMPGMKVMTYAMPVMFLFIFNDYASGLSYYYFLSLLITILQTWLTRKFVNEDKVRAEMAANAKKPRKKTGFMARLEEAQRQQQAALRAQQKKGGKR
ncbi:MAG: membrane protein insertase YidC [Muribaculaceae bacterium]|nr:membrane protein insertase YidC [Muribaculaceae bacterium]